MSDATNQTRLPRFAPVLLVCVLFACGSNEPAEPTASVQSTATSRPSTGAVGDDRGDAYMRSGEPAPGYLDQVEGIVTTEDEATLRFVDELAEPLPAEPGLPEGDEALGWSFCVDTDPGVSPVGFPMRAAMPCEFIVHIRWDGDELRAMLIDRRPLVDDRDARVEDVPVTPGDSSVEAVVPIQSLDNPKRFGWSMFTEELGALGTNRVYHIDETPEGGVGDPETWRSS